MPKTLPPEEHDAFFDRSYYTDPEHPQGWYSIGDRPANLEEEEDYSWEDAARTLLALFPEATSFLDVGCGTGNIMDALVAVGAQQNRTIEVWGIDLSSAALDLAQPETRQRMALMDIAQASPVNLAMAGLPVRFDAVYAFGVLQYFEEEVLREVLERLFTLARRGFYTENEDEAARDPHVHVRSPKQWHALVKDVSPAGWRTTLHPAEQSFLLVDSVLAEWTPSRTEHVYDDYTVVVHNLPTAPFEATPLHCRASIETLFQLDGWGMYDLYYHGQLVASVPHATASGQELYEWFEYIREFPQTSCCHRWYCTDPKYLLKLAQLCNEHPEELGTFTLRHLWPEPTVVEVFGSTPFMFHDGDSWLIPRTKTEEAFVALVGAAHSAKTRRKYRSKIRKHRAMGDFCAVRVDAQRVFERDFMSLIRNSNFRDEDEDPNTFDLWFEINYTHILELARTAPDYLRVFEILRDGKLWGVDIWARLEWTQGVWERLWFGHVPLSKHERHVALGQVFTWLSSQALAAENGSYLSHGADAVEILEEQYTAGYYKRDFASSYAVSLTVNSDDSYGIPEELLLPGIHPKQ